MKRMLLLLSFCAIVMMVSATCFAQAPAAPAKPADHPTAAAKPADHPTAAKAADTKTVTGVLTVNVEKKEASIKVGEATTKLEWNKVVENCKLAGKKVEAKGTMKDNVLTAIEIKEAAAPPAAPKADAPKADAPKADAPKPAAPAAK